VKRNLIITAIAIFAVGVWVANFYYSPSEGFKFTRGTTYQPFSSSDESAIEPSIANVSADGVLVTRVIDGDTIEIEGGTTVRYIGIDTPETSHPTKGVQCFGREATNKNKELVEGKRVRLEKDVSETDKFGRLLRYVYLDDEFINERLVREGFAHSSAFPPDVKYQDLFVSAQEIARSNNAGLWNACNIAGTTTTAASGCLIKGNVSSSGKIYHLPNQKYYNQTVVDESKGERWFCSEEEALKAGWRKSKV
jgi:micrococcal nuclease